MSICGVSKRVSFFLIVVSWVFQVAVADEAAGTRATVVWYLEQEAGIEPYRVRYIVTPDFMRSDEGRDDGDYTLFDRGQAAVYSVVPANRMVLRIEGGGKVPEVPENLAFEVRTETDEQAPRIGGVAPLRVDLVAGETVCHSALVAGDMLQPVQKAMQAFMQALAVQQGRTLANTPADYQTPCFLLRYVYRNDFHWAQGMVLADWNTQGERRELIDYQTDVPVPDALFELPEDYVQMPPGGR